MSSLQLKIAAAAVAACLATPGVHAGENYNEWFSQSFDAGTATGAFTVNDSGATFGEICRLQEGSCQWRLLLDLACEDNTTTSILANTDQGASTLEFRCAGKSENGKGYLYVFKNWKQLESSLKSSSKVGFAMPVKGDQFVVYRFKLQGMTETTSEMETRFFAMVEALKQNGAAPEGTRTQKL